MHKTQTFFDSRSSTLTYVVYDSDSKDALVIDPVLDYDPRASKVWMESVDEVIAFIKKEDLKLHYIFETHAHADHLSGAQFLKNVFPKSKTAIGQRIKTVQKTFKMVFDLPDAFPTDGRQFDHLLEDDEIVRVGKIDVKIISTPGHTPACTTLLIDDALYTGDVIFMPDSGSGRCDFPGGSSTDMYRSVQRLYGMDENLRVFVGHDYQPNGRELAYKSTIAEQKKKNVAIDALKSEADFVAWRDQRDQSLEAPKLLFQSLQVNVDAGTLPELNVKEKRFLKIPINVFRPVQGKDDVIELSDAKK